MGGPWLPPSRALELGAGATGFASVSGLGATAGSPSSVYFRGDIWFWDGETHAKLRTSRGDTDCSSISVSVANRRPPRILFWEGHGSPRAVSFDPTDSPSVRNHDSAPPASNRSVTNRRERAIDSCFADMVPGREWGSRVHPSQRQVRSTSRTRRPSAAPRRICLRTNGND